MLYSAKIYSPDNSTSFSLLKKPWESDKSCQKLNVSPSEILSQRINADFRFVANDVIAQLKKQMNHVTLDEHNESDHCSQGTACLMSRSFSVRPARQKPMSSFCVSINGILRNDQCSRVIKHRLLRNTFLKP